MQLRRAVAVAVSVFAIPAQAGELAPEAARQFVAGKLFSYTCFEGTSGAGRINADGSVAGTIRIGGTGPVRFVTLPPGTVKVSPTSICASVHGAPIKPCFRVVQTDAHRFRGSVAGLTFAYCDFVRRGPRVHVASSENPVLALRPAIATTRAGE
ncbi:MAG TPA: hypothetical protein VIH40_11500 [Xanthobacteraceae bacterium]